MNLIKNVKDIINSTKFEFIEDDHRIIVYNQKKLDKSYGSKFAKQLGSFYKCVTNNLFPKILVYF
jgi:hypothetical protein